MKIGIDLGGSHIGVGLIDNQGKLIEKKEIDIKKENKENIENFILENIVELINTILIYRNLMINDIELIGIAAPGLVQDGVIIKSKNLNLKNFNIVQSLNEYFSIPIMLNNDCKCAALAERKYGKLKGYSNCLFLSIGTGIGGAAFIDGNLLETSRTTGFGMGHTIIKMEGKACACGNNGCFETYGSIANLRNMVKNKLNLKEDINGKEVITFLNDTNLKDILEPTIEEYINYLNIGICNLINIFGPEAIVLGGSIAFYEEIFLDRLKNSIRKTGYLYNDEFFPEIKMAVLKNDAGMIGATIEK